MQNRRSFIKSAALAPAAVAGLNPAARGANERINVGLIGAHNQGFHVARRMAKHARIKTLCDLDEAVIADKAPQIGEIQGVQPAPEAHFERVLEDKDIDAVVIAVPDHWHTHIGLLACQAGKDVYIEKPLSQTIAEGHLLRAAARKYDRVMQVGTQRRSGEHFRTAAEYAASGKLGKVCEIRTWIYQVRKSIGNPPDGDPPATVDYDRWLGPAPRRPFNPMRFHYNWRFFYDYGNTELGNQGVHMLDVAIWGVQNMRGGLKNCLPTRVSSNDGIYWLDDMKEVPDTQVITYDYGDLLLTWELRSFSSATPRSGTTAGISFHGSDGALFVDGDGWQVYDGKGEPVESAVASPDNLVELHGLNFLECIKSRKRPHSDVEIGRLSTTLCHLGNIASHLRRDVMFDPRTETFGYDDEANALLKKQYRAKYPLPRV